MKLRTKLKGRKIKCENIYCDKYKDCTKYADDHHHLYSNDKKNRKVYGDLIDEDFNIMYINNDCHITKVIPKLTEIEFRTRAKEAGYILPAVSKSMQYKIF